MVGGSPSCACGRGMTVKIGHVAVEEIPMISASDPRVGTNVHETAVNVLWGDRVESTADVEECGKAVRFAVDVQFALI